MVLRYHTYELKVNGTRSRHEVSYPSFYSTTESHQSKELVICGATRSHASLSVAFSRFPPDELSFFYRDD